MLNHAIVCLMHSQKWYQTALLHARHKKAVSTPLPYLKNSRRVYYWEMYQKPEYYNTVQFDINFSQKPHIRIKSLFETIFTLIKR